MEFLCAEEGGKAGVLRNGKLLQKCSSRSPEFELYPGAQAF
jgi:hypothetical protein